eukprot:Em0003g302a
MSIPALQMSLFRVGTEERKPAAFGITVTSSLTPAILNEASMAVGAAAFAAEFRKHAANDAKCQELGWSCDLLAIETYGDWRKLRGSECVLPPSLSACNQLGP